MARPSASHDAADEMLFGSVIMLALVVKWFFLGKHRITLKQLEEEGLRLPKDDDRLRHIARSATRDANDRKMRPPGFGSKRVEIRYDARHQRFGIYVS